MKDLVIVESPTKAKTISRFLGKDFNIQSSYGHLRDLPKKEMGVDIEHDFEPKYVVPKKNQKAVTALKKAAEKSEYIYFATDEDREGEAISWHLAQILKPPAKKIKRITFHEITKEAIEDALKNPRQIDLKLVDAQQARRILDRLVGYELSPFLWKKVAKGLSAGRVQSVAVRLVVEREREIQAFVPQEYWNIEAELKSDDQNFLAKLHEVDGKKLDKLGIKSKNEADAILKNLQAAEYIVKDIQKKEVRKSPLPPFTTSVLQQEANRRLGFSPKQTMMFAQQLYEGVELGSDGSVGLITYMRTDSVNLADKFINEAKSYIQKEFGEQYALKTPRRFKAKSKLVQEAHEAIRPTNASLSPESIKQYLDDRQFRLYNLIWKRAIACQMSEAVLDNTNADIKAKKYIFRAAGSIVKFDGFLKVFGQDAKDLILPDLKINEQLELIKLIPNQKFTQPPARYSEAGLIKALEERGIGRPSTYAPTISTIQERNYVEKEERRLKPTDIGILVNDLLVEHFPKIVDYQFTAKMEDELDNIAQGEKQWVPVIKEFYQPFKDNLMQKYDEVSKKELTEEETDEVCEKCNKPMVIKTGRYGKFLACTGFPECRNTKPLNGEGQPETETPQETDETCDKCGAKMVIKKGRYGPFLSCSKYPECKTMKPLRKSTGVKCPECGKGEIVEKRSRQGKTFYACDQYPNCKFALWSKPTGEQCPDCKALLVYAKDDKARCSNKECKFEK